MADVLIKKKYIFDRDFTAVQFQEFQTPPSDTSNKSFLKGTIVDGVIKIGYAGDYRVVTDDGYDITDAVSLAPEVVIQPNNHTDNNPVMIMKEPTFTKGEKTFIFVVILILVVIIIVNEAK